LRKKRLQNTDSLGGNLFYASHGIDEGENGSYRESQRGGTATCLHSMSFYLVRQSFKLGRRVLFAARLSQTHSKSYTASSKPQTDSCGIPLHPTWSVNDLLSSYPTPTITSSTLKRLHELSALIPPEEGTAEHDSLKRELENLIKLVEAVKLVSLGDNPGGISGEKQIPDGRLCAEGTGMRSMRVPAEVDGEVTGSALLRFANRTSDGLYVVDADRTK
jgi:hypothetical protein